MSTTERVSCIRRASRLATRSLATLLKISALVAAASFIDSHVASVPRFNSTTGTFATPINAASLVVPGSRNDSSDSVVMTDYGYSAAHGFSVPLMAATVAILTNPGTSQVAAVLATGLLPALFVEANASLEQRMIDAYTYSGPYVAATLEQVKIFAQRVELETHVAASVRRLFPAFHTFVNSVMPEREAKSFWHSAFYGVQRSGLDYGIMPKFVSEHGPMYDAMDQSVAFAEQIRTASIQFISGVHHWVNIYGSRLSSNAANLLIDLQEQLKSLHQEHGTHFPDKRSVAIFLFHAMRLVTGVALISSILCGVSTSTTYFTRAAQSLLTKECEKAVDNLTPSPLQEINSLSTPRRMLDASSVRLRSSPDTGRLLLNAFSHAEAAPGHQEEVGSPQASYYRCASQRMHRVLESAS